jgi:O-antigen/teichoic acid export membrane protein
LLGDNAFREEPDALMTTLPRRFRRNVLTTYVTMVVSAAQVLLVTPLLVRGLGPERYGIWTLVASFGLFAALLDLGLASATTRYVAHYEELGERPQLLRTINVSFWILLGLGTLVLLAGLLFAPLFPRLFDVPGEETAASVLVVLAAAAVALVIVGGTAQGCLAGLQRYGFLNFTYTSAVILQATAFAVVLWLGGQIVALGVVLLSVVLAEQVARFLAMRHYVPEVTLSPRNVERASAWEMLRVSAWLSSTQVATAVRYRMDTIVVGFVAGVRAAGVYAVGQFLFIAVDRFIRPSLTGFFPFSAELAGRRDTESLRNAMVLGTRIALAVAGPLCLAAILLAGPFVDAWVGPGYGEARLVVVYLVSALLLATVSRTGLLMLQGSGRVRAPATIVWAEAALNFGLSIALGLALGLTGVALATLIATVVVSTAIGIPYLCRIFGVPIGAFVIGIARAHVPAVAVALLTGWLVTPDEGAGLLSVLAAGFAIATAYLLTLSVTGLSRDQRRRLWAFLRRVESGAAGEHGG